MRCYLSDFFVSHLSPQPYPLPERRIGLLISPGPEGGGQSGAFEFSRDSDLAPTFCQTHAQSNMDEVEDAFVTVLEI